MGKCCICFISLCIFLSCSSFNNFDYRFLVGSSSSGDESYLILSGIITRNDLQNIDNILTRNDLFLNREILEVNNVAIDSLGSDSDEIIQRNDLSATLSEDILIKSTSLFMTCDAILSIKSSKGYEESDEINLYDSNFLYADVDSDGYFEIKVYASSYIAQLTNFTIRNELTGDPIVSFNFQKGSALFEGIEMQDADIDLGEIRFSSERASIDINDIPDIIGIEEIDVEDSIDDEASLEAGSENAQGENVLTDKNENEDEEEVETYQSCNNLDSIDSLFLSTNIDENEGSIISDYSSSENEGTLYNGSWGNGSIVDGMQTTYFDGSSTFIRFPDIGPALEDEITVMAWVDRASISLGDTIISKWNMDQNDGDSFFLSVGWDAASFMVDTWNGSYNEGEAIHINSNRQWYHIAGSYTKNTIKLYVNGELIGSQNISGDDLKYDATIPYDIGKQYNPNDEDSEDNYWFKGYISGVKVFNTEISEEAISAYYECMDNFVD
ncbi:MAG: LamG domain-containing protein [Pseudomonadota bacterium]